MPAPEITIFAEFDDPEFAAEIRETIEREHRSMKAVVMLALRDYIARSKASAKIEKLTKQVAA